MRSATKPTRYSGRCKPSSAERDARTAVKWLVRLEEARQRPSVSPLRARPDTVAAALAWWQLALRLGGCRNGRHYARQVRDAAIARKYVIDTGCVDTPKGQGRYKQSGRVRWWPIYVITKRLRGDLGHHSYWTQQPSCAKIASLCSDHIRQVLRKRSRPAYGSVQAAFRATGPP